MLPRMRTIDQTVEWLQENDPDTAFTKTALRRLVITGQLPGVVRIGQKYLVNLDALERFLGGGENKEAALDVSVIEDGMGAGRDWDTGPVRLHFDSTTTAERRQGMKRREWI